MYFAELDENKKVIRVIVADQEFINSGKVGNPSNWVETKIDGKKQYAGIGYVFDNAKNDFLSPKKQSLLSPTETEIFNK